MAWPTVCRSFLGEKEDDSSLPIGLWDHPGAFLNGKGGRWKPINGNTSAGSAASEFPSAAAASPTAAANATATGELSVRETRLTKEQRDAMRLLCANLVAFPSRPRRARWPPDRET